MKILNSTKLPKADDLVVPIFLILTLLSDDFVLIFANGSESEQSDEEFSSCLDLLFESPIDPFPLRAKTLTSKSSSGTNLLEEPSGCVWYLLASAAFFLHL